MKVFIQLVQSAMFMSLVLHASAQADVSAKTVTQAYVEEAYSQYTLALQGARKIQNAVEAFLQQPTEENLIKARATWTEERKIYSETEIYRFYGSPIDDEDGPEGLINAWPLDEGYIDEIIKRADLYPQIDTQLLRDLNEKDGEKNISTGFHAIEFMLWGQDTSANSAGQRPASDFDPKVDVLAARRGQYLRQVTAMLVEDIESVQKEWDLSSPKSYARSFMSDSQTALTNMLTGVVSMTGGELSQERMFVALDTGEQEEEHSCFSDTTHFDILHNFLGAKIVLQNQLLELIRKQDAHVAAEIEDNLILTEQSILAIPAPFDQAILNSKGQVLHAIDQLEVLTESVRQGAMTLGVQLP